jgi:predicted Zn-dependent protease
VGGFFYNLGRAVGSGARKANWVFQSLTGSEGDALQAEHTVGKDLALAYAKETELDPDPATQAFLDRISSRLVPCVSKKEQQFCFRAVHKEEFNALAMPGGFIFVMRPLLELCEWDENEIAFVLGHEMGHVLLKHAINRIMTSSAICAGMMRFPVGGLLGVGILHLVTDLLNQGHSREQELEADGLATQLVHYAGFDPEGGPRLLQRLGGVPTERWLDSTYFSSHPPVEARVENIGKKLQQLGKAARE